MEKPNTVLMLIAMYKRMSEKQRQEEIDAMFDIIYAMLEVCECDSIESFPNPNVKLSFRCDVLKDEDQRYFC